eukprot:231228_1
MYFSIVKISPLVCLAHLILSPYCLTNAFTTPSPLSGNRFQTETTLSTRRPRPETLTPFERRTQRSSQLMAFFNDNNNQKDDEYDDDDDDDDDEVMEINSTPEILQSAREQFELMMSIPSDNQESSHDPKQEIESGSASSSSMDEEERYNHGTRTISKAVLSNRDS